ncbi:MAG: DUF5711 family protein [Firmicutes bacterium]|nr:DUF5711 family protein [Bacillota bacterium]
MPKGSKKSGGAGSKIARKVKRSMNAVNFDGSLLDSIKAKTLVKLIFAALALFSVIFLIVSRADLSPSAIVSGIRDKRILSQADGEGYPVEIEGSRSVDIESVSNGTAVLTDTNYMMFNDKGQKVASYAHYMASPAMKIAGRYTLLYDEGNMSYSLKTLSSSILSKKSDNSIITAALSRTGRFVLVTNHETAFSEVSVYSKSGNLLHRWRSGNYYINAVTMSESGSHIAMCGVTTENGIMKSVVIIQKVGDDKNLQEYTFGDTLMLYVCFSDSDRVTAIGDNICAQLDVNSNNRTKYDYSGSTLTGFDTDSKGNVALVISQNADGRNCVVAVLNKKGEKIANISTNLTSPSVELDSNSVNLISQSHFYSYNYDGIKIDEAEVPADSQESVTSGGKTLIRGVTMITQLK